MKKEVLSLMVATLAITTFAHADWQNSWQTSDNSSTNRNYYSNTPSGDNPQYSQGQYSGSNDSNTSNRSYYSNTPSNSQYSQGQYSESNPQYNQNQYSDSQYSQSNKSQRDFPMDKAASSSDEQLNRKIRDKVSKGWLWNSYKDVILNTSNGVVTLDGTVSNPNEQQKLINEITKIDGVKAVKSNLRFKNS